MWQTSGSQKTPISGWGQDAALLSTTCPVEPCSTGLVWALLTGRHANPGLQGTVAEALDEFAEWHPMIRGLIERSAPPYKWALYDREPLADWVSGNIALMGDAAHAMLPYHAQGAGQSIEDAWVLARALALHQDTGAALNLYSTLRQPRTRQVQEASRAAEHLFHLHEPDEVARRNKRFSVAQTRIGDGFPPGQEWLFAYDAEAAATGADDEWRKLNWRA